MYQIAALLTTALLLVACATPETARPVAATPGTGGYAFSAFSKGQAGSLPAGWEPVIILHQKKPTQYRLVSKENRVVLHARADNASSGLMYKTLMDPAARPWLEWQWKIADVLTRADNTRRGTEDSPVRVVLGFDGDKDSLPFSDQIMFDTAKLLTGHDFPYATLMYIWENKAPVGSVITSPHSSRVRMMVASQGTAGIGKWHTLSRNIIEDFEKAYGEKPGKLIGIGVLTDTDNTGDTVEAWYGDIRLLSSRN